MRFAHIEHTIMFSTARLINHYILVQNIFIMAQYRTKPFVRDRHQKHTQHTIYNTGLRP